VAITRACYASVGDLRAASDVRTTAYLRRQLERAVETGSQAVDDLLNRTFYPQTRTIKFDWPDWRQGTSYRLWLEEYELVSITSLTVAGTALTEGTDYILRPAEGPPYDRIEILLSGTASFTAGDTWQESIVIVGDTGYDDRTTIAATSAEALDATETGIDVGACPDLDAGDLITIGSERMIITSRSLLDSGVNTAGALTAALSDSSVSVGDGTAFAEGETITIDSERILILDIAGNTLLVQRAVDGSVLATHTTATDIYAPRTLNVTRGALGSTAATHDTASPVLRQAYPSLVRALALAEAQNILMQERSAYARTVGSGEGERNASGAGLAALRKKAEDSDLYRSRGPWVV